MVCPLTTASRSMRTLIIGAGRMGRRHVAVARDLGLEVVGVCDVRRDSLAAAEREYRLPAGSLFTETSQAFAAAPQLVIVSTTADSHCELTCQAIERGAKYVLCEKPMATSLADCDRMLAAARRHGARLAINHAMRFQEIYTAPRTIMASAEFGGLASMTVVAGNMGLAMNSTHIFEAFRLAANEPVAEVAAWFAAETFPNPRGPQFEDQAGCIRAVTRSGKRLYLEASADQGHGACSIYAGLFGQLWVDEITGAMHLSTRRPEDRALPSTRYACSPVESSRTVGGSDAVAGAGAVIRALLDGKDYPNGEDGRAAVRALVAAYVSHENGHRAVACDGDLPLERNFAWA